MDQENEIIADDEAATAEVVETPETPEVETKEVSIDDAIAKAMEKHRPVEETEKPTTALPKQDNVVEASKPEGKNFDPLTGNEVEPIKAPASLTPALREKWKEIDPRFQKFWVDRERDMTTKLNETATERKLASEFKDIASPYEPMLRQFNMTATQHAKELFNLSHSLNTGTPQQKAQIIYNLINHFKPDPEALGQLFAGSPVSQQAPQQAQNVEAEVQRILAEREQQTVEQRSEYAIQAFASNPDNEYFEDVKVKMGKIIDAELVSGATESELLKNAYDLACSQHPEIRDILKSRQAAVVQPTTTPTTTPIKSIKPSLGNGKKQSNAPKNMSIDDAIAAAMAQHGM